MRIIPLGGIHDRSIIHSVLIKVRAMDVSIFLLALPQSRRLSSLLPLQGAGKQHDHTHRRLLHSLPACDYHVSLYLITVLIFISLGPSHSLPFPHCYVLPSISIPPHYCSILGLFHSLPSSLYYVSSLLCRCCFVLWELYHSLL